MSMEQQVQQDLLEQVRPAWRVLVVDDHASFRRCASELLVAEGFDVVGEAEDGASALALAARLVPELVLLDIQLPDLDGLAVAERLLAVHPELKIVLISSRDRSTYGSRIEACGARGFIAKGELSGAALERFLE
jgi:DNA-binding NarL/FixJ family response regulator